jgi:hypothetical protein
VAERLEAFQEGLSSMELVNIFRSLFVYTCIVLHSYHGM